MADSGMAPDWLRREQVERELRTAREEAQKQRKSAAKLRLQIERPKFWQSLVEKLKIAVDSLPLIGL